MVVLTEVRADRVVCHCLGVTESAILQTVDAACLTSVQAISQCTGAGSGCTACHRLIQELVDSAAERRQALLNGEAA